MQTRSIALFFLFACVLLSVVRLSPAEDDTFYWLNNYAEAIREAKKTGKPILLEFRCEP